MLYESSSEIDTLSDQEKLLHFQQAFQELDRSTKLILHSVPKNISKHNRSNTVQLIKNLLHTTNDSLESATPHFEAIQITQYLKEIKQIFYQIQSLRYQMIEQNINHDSDQAQIFMQQIEVLHAKIQLNFQQAIYDLA